MEIDFPFFGSSLAHLELEVELFEVWEIMVRQIIITIMSSIFLTRPVCSTSFWLDPPRLNKLRSQELQMQHSMF